MDIATATGGAGGNGGNGGSKFMSGNVAGGNGGNGGAASAAASAYGTTGNPTAAALATGGAGGAGGLAGGNGGNGGVASLGMVSATNNNTDSFVEGTVVGGNGGIGVGGGGGGNGALKPSITALPSAALSTFNSLPPAATVAVATLALRGSPAMAPPRSATPSAPTVLVISCKHSVQGVMAAIAKTQPALMAATALPRPTSPPSEMRALTPLPIKTISSRPTEP